MYYKKIISFKKSFFFFVLLIITIVNTYGQTSSICNFRSYWQFNANAGTSLFFGDIKQYRVWPVINDQSEWRLGVGAQIIKQISPVFGVRGQIVFGQLSGTNRDADRYFTSNYIEFNLNSTISINNIIGTYRSNRFWDIYLTAGVGITNYNTELKNHSTNAVIRTVGYGSGKSFGGRTLQGIITLGVGANIRLSDLWNLNFEFVYRGMNSDELDGVISGSAYDGYNYTSMGISYKFGVSSKAKGRKVNVCNPWN